jgi:hypothetical protein
MSQEGIRSHRAIHVQPTEDIHNKYKKFYLNFSVVFAQKKLKFCEIESAVKLAYRRIFAKCNPIFLGKCLWVTDNREITDAKCIYSEGNMSSSK